MKDPARKINREVREMLRAAGFTLKRMNRHAIFWRERDNATITVSLSPRSGNDVNYVRQKIAQCDRPRDRSRQAT